jgi:Flp pilus assembly secretin CpaC
MAYTMRNRAFARFGFLSLGLGLIMWPALALAAPEAVAVAVNVDQAKLVRLPGKVATIVVGNPLIADVSLQPGGIIVVTGKGYGATNFIALDRGGEILVDRQIQVEGPSDRLVTVYRGIERESYSCMPICQRRVTLGDSDAYFNNTIGQAGTLNSSASGNANSAAKTN